MTGRDLLIALIAAVSPTTMPAQLHTPIVASPNGHLVLRISVQFHFVGVGETTPMHSHPAYVAYVFDAYTGKAVLAIGTEVPLSRKAGDVFYGEPVTHQIVNTGTRLSTI
jgi:hypothetical protein